jgi:hypothetical protein
MSSLIITKQSGNFFSLVLDGGTPIISEQNRLTTIGNFCNFKTANGANLILKQNILYSEITIVTGVSYVPTSINNLWTSLISAGFFDGIALTGGGATIDRFDELLDTFSYFGRDGQLLIVNESELKLDTIAYQIFTEADKLKLQGIEAGAQVNVNPNWLESNPASKSYIQNKPVISSNFTAVYEEIFLASNTNTFTLPIGVIPQFITIDRGVKYKTTDWTVADNIVTILGDALLDADVYIVGLQS